MSMNIQAGVNTLIGQSAQAATQIQGIGLIREANLRAKEALERADAEIKARQEQKEWQQQKWEELKNRPSAVSLTPDEKREADEQFTNELAEQEMREQKEYQQKQKEAAERAEIRKRLLEGGKL